MKWYFDMKLSHEIKSLSPKKELYHGDSVVQSWVSGNPGYSLADCFS